MQYAREERRFRLSGYSGRTTEATVALVTFDRGQRRQRAWLGLSTWWAVAAATAFIPVAHFILVPGFFGFGIYSFVRRNGTALVALSARGACPDCNQEQDFAVPERWDADVSLPCGSCGRSLRLDDL